MPPVDTHLTLGSILSLCILVLVCLLQNPESKKSDHLAVEFYKFKLTRTAIQNRYILFVFRQESRHSWGLDGLCANDICWKIHHQFDKGRWHNRGPTPNWLAPGVKSLRQIMSMSQHREFDLHKNTSILSDGQKHTRNSLPSLGLCSSMWIPLLQSSISCQSLRYPGLSKPFGSG